MDINLAKLTQSVQHNCSISDATYAGHYTLCIYLLKMREYYRWEKGLDFRDQIDNEEIGHWLNEREVHWETLEDESFLPIRINGTDFDAFDSAAINQLLTDNGMVYSAGYVLRGKPHFFLANLEQHLVQDDYQIFISGKEHARELSAPPALSQGRTIFIRAESLRRTIWEKVEESLWNKSESPLTHAIGCYDFKKKLDDSLQAMCSNELKTLVAHEIGEIKAGKLIDTETWSSLLSDVQATPIELMLRAIRDNLADCISTLPDLITADDPARLHFFIAMLSNMRKAIFPSLRDAYDDWQRSGSTAALQDITDSGSQHWHDLAKAIVTLYQKNGTSDLSAYKTLIDSNTL